MLQDAPRMAHPLGNSVSAKASCFLYSASWPNATAQPLPKAEATQERTLEGVGCSALFGPVLVTGGLEHRFLTPCLGVFQPMMVS